MFGRIITTIGILLVLLSSNLCLAALNLQQPGTYKLSPYIEYWQDSEDNTPLENVSRLTQWQQSSAEDINLGISPKPYWFKSIIELSSPFQHQGIKENTADWFLRITYPPLDNIELYLCRNEIISDIKHECEHYLAGDRLPFEQRIRSTPNYILPLNLHVGKNYLYLKVSTEGSYQLPISVLDDRSLSDFLSINDFYRGGFITLMLIMVLYNTFIFFMTRSITYLFYSGFVLSFAFLHLAYQGSGFQYLWPNWPEFNQYAMLIAFSLNQIFTILFVTNFLNIKRISNRIYNYFTLLLLLVALPLILIPFVPYKFFLPVQNAFSLIVTVSAFYFGLRFWRQGQSMARLFTIAWAVLIIGIATANLRTLGILPTNFFTQYGYQIGSFIEIVLLSLALGERIMRLQIDRTKAKQDLVIEKQEHMIALKQLISGVSHEMNTPIGNIALANSFLSDMNNDMKGKLDPKSDSFELINDFQQQQTDINQTIGNSVTSLAELTKVFKNISFNKEELALVTFDLTEVIQRLIKKTDDDVQFQQSLPEELFLQSYLEALTVIIEQIIDNALEHFPKEKSLQELSISIAIRTSKENLVIKISDNGIGLSEEHLKQLFQPFFTTARGKRKRLGLGMYQIKNIVNELFSGSIEAKNSHSKGLKIKICIPFNESLKRIAQ